MTIIQNDRTAYIDVDDTLVQIHPQGELDVVDVGIDAKVRVNQAVVRAIREHKARGHAVIVWSHGGYRWAEAVVRALKLDVDAVMCKPNWFYDDLPAEALGVRIPMEGRFDEFQGLANGNSHLSQT